MHVLCNLKVKQNGKNIVDQETYLMAYRRIQIENIKYQIGSAGVIGLVLEGLQIKKEDGL
jgi:hypothetical protein